MAIYKLKKSPIDGTISTVLKQDIPDIITSIPFDSANTDYQMYLALVAEGNSADAAD